MIDIQSSANPQFKSWLRLVQASRQIRRAGMTLAEGAHLLAAALDAGIQPLGVIWRGQTVPGAELTALLKRLAAPVPQWQLAPALFDQLSPVEHGSGLLALLPVPSTPLPVQLAQDMLYLDGVQDPGNVGAILRTAAAAGVRHVLCAEGTALAWTPKVLRAAMGAHFQLALYEQVSVDQARDALSGTWLVAQAHQATDLWQLTWPAGAVGWIFGSEGAGPRPDTAAMADQAVTISCSGLVESLNVAAATAVCLFERRRRLQTA
jgi:TrmH family RNA methyltransferase